MTLSAHERERYSRHLALPEIAEAGQEKLRAARVLVIGVGGLGSPAALYLAAAGVGRIGLLDCDRIEVSNLQRQVLFETTEVGEPKADAARARLLALNPEIEVIAHNVELAAANAKAILSGYDVVLDGTDRLRTRYLVNDACVLLARPLVTAAIHRFEGQAMTYLPGRGPCYRCLFPAVAEGMVGNCATAGVLGVLPGVLGAIQAAEAIKVVTGVGDPLVGRLLTFDALQMRFQEFRFERRTDCAVCGSRATITDLTDLADTPRAAPADSPEAVRRLSPAALRALMVERSVGGEAVMLIDVREPREFAVAHLEGAINIPVGQLATRLGEIPRATTPVFMCRSGARSLIAGAIALRAAFPTSAHLEGGLLAWAAEIDPAFRVAASG